MSRIHTILEKAERDGAISRFDSQTAVDLLPRAPATSDAAVPVATAAAPHSSVPSPDRPVEPEPEPPAAPVFVISETREVPASSAVAPPSSAVLPAASAPPVQLADALVTARQPHALVSEQFRTLRTRLTNSINGRGARVLVVTSPGRGEGKSVVAANLALTMGQEIRQRVCLVDAALRDPSLHELFGLAESPGLTDVLSGRVPLDAALTTLEPYQLTLLPAGSVSTNPAELLGGADMRRIIAVLRSRFDRVVIDASSATPTADVATLLPLVDGILMVARAGVTGAPAITHAVSALGASHIVGMVLNDSQD
jgi:capsular exopolysaccharide synthesis family protein